jgi:acyl-coenzyme A thioesterase PaaI-like protein
LKRTRGRTDWNSARGGHSRCLMCGNRNPWSLGLRFTVDAEGVAHARFQSRAELQGYDGILHGGMICALLDAVMMHCLFSRDIPAVTGDMHVRFLRPVACDALVDLRAWIVLEHPPLYRISAELLEGTHIAARAVATFMRKPDRKVRSSFR